MAPSPSRFALSRPLLWPSRKSSCTELDEVGDVVIVHFVLEIFDPRVEHLDDLAALLCVDEDVVLIRTAHPAAESMVEVELGLGNQKLGQFGRNAGIRDGNRLLYLEVSLLEGLHISVDGFRIRVPNFAHLDAVDALEQSFRLCETP